jgi:hypothetical protein
VGQRSIFNPGNPVFADQRTPEPPRIRGVAMDRPKLPFPESLLDQFRETRLVY